jgi:hypothetical protein
MELKRHSSLFFSCAKIINKANVPAWGKKIFLFLLVATVLDVHIIAMDHVLKVH